MIRESRTVTLLPPVWNERGAIRVGLGSPSLISKLARLGVGTDFLLERLTRFLACKGVICPVYPVMKTCFVAIALSGFLASAFLGPAFPLPVCVHHLLCDLHIPCASTPFQIRCWQRAIGLADVEPI